MNSRFFPRHVAIIMDGNGRWANRRGLPRTVGYRAGAKTVRKVIGFARKKGIEILTLFAFSIENRARPQKDVSFLMSLFLNALECDTDTLHKNNICLRVVGDHKECDSKLLVQIHASQELTKNNTGLKLVIALNYSGRWDIVQATQRLGEKIRNGELNPRKVTVKLFQKHLCLNDLPDPDLLIRTSGEQRLSNFMLWQMAYTEVYFTSICWPDFSPSNFEQALAFYQARQRRFGLISEQIKE
ncbi:polyprenyl diphosphate synthase [Coxiella endosymbiont of Amblyomma americanum]|uniref:polyprenyl diphosphate synthase n=1 Tax=Coxiella endosymbiont of Amblyomma americanum TaxID=325775 RepID=UPI00057C4520|nr:polyprenyl diphosphate synthase [Coxiella endosymbiont of Amblyomma americanum]AJC50302.1 UDP pyrophosphate synthase [Coxiella endosymbiont of Amblyomma americanum]AUJ58653.1 di-trans,poly-cis-decaprenylcistransferase [Coxiella-like endosymbiont of Amblyomma americanum]